MTDKDIKKALHRCSVDSDCRDCPMKEGGDCIRRLAKQSLGMINRLEKENDALINSCKACQMDGIKEFAFRFKKKLGCALGYDDIYRDPRGEIDRLIDLTMKEMTEGGNV